MLCINQEITFFLYSQWAMPQIKVSEQYADGEDQDKPAYLHSLTRVFTVHCHSVEDKQYVLNMGNSHILKDTISLDVSPPSRHMTFIQRRIDVGATS